MTPGGVRCTPAERAAFKRLHIHGTGQCDEPALGSLDERLGIIIRRLGGRTTTPRLTRYEREQLAEARIS